MTDHALTTLDTARALAYVAGEGYQYEQAISAAVDAWGALNRHGMAFGLHCLALRTREESGRYLAALAQAGIPRRTASRFVGRVSFLLENQAWVRLAHLPGEHMDVLRKLPRPLLERALAEGPDTLAGRPIGDVAKLTCHECKKLVLGYVDEAPDVPRAPRDPVAEVVAAVQRLTDEQRAEFARRLSILPLLKRTPWHVTRREVAP